MKLKAEKRDLAGKKVKRIRKAGKLPAVIYGPDRKSLNLILDPREFKQIFREMGYNQLFDLEILGEPGINKVLVKEVQINPINDEYMHVDLYQIDMNKKIVVDVPVEVSGVSPAVKNNIGFLVTPVEAIKVICLPGNIPEKFVINIEGLEEVNDSIQIGNINMPEGVELDASMNKDTVVAQVVPPQKEIIEEAPVVEAAAEGEEAETKALDEGDEVKDSKEEKEELKT